MRFKLLPIALALSVAPIFAHGEDLMQAYRQALANDPTLAQSDAERLISHEGVVQARSALLPQISAGMSLEQDNNNSSSSTSSTSTSQYNPYIYDQNGNPSPYVYDINGNRLPSGVVASSGFDTGHTRSRSLSATLSQSILDLSKWADVETAKSQQQAQTATYQAAVQDLMVRVAQAYFNVLTAEDTLRFNQSLEQSLERQLEQSQQRFKVGLSAITDVQDAKAQHDSAVAEVIAAKNSLDDAREALTQITGQPATDLKPLRQDLPLTPPVPNNLKQWVQTAMSNNPSVQSQEYSVEAAEHSISSARAGHLPTLSASVSYGKSDAWTENGGFHSHTPSHTTIGLTLTVPIFTGGFTQSQVRQAIYSRDSSKDALEAQRRLTVRNTRNFYRSVLAGISQVQATKAAVTSSKSALEATQAGFEVGTRNIVDVLNAQQEVTSAQSNYSQARHQYVLDKLLLKQAAGTLAPSDLQAVNTLLQ